MVEINLSSNAIILGVHGKNHPLATYLAAGVPVVLSTDDAGVSRINMTNEYFRAVHDQGLDYPTLKSIARNALIHSFLDETPKAQRAGALRSLLRRIRAIAGAAAVGAAERDRADQGRRRSVLN